MNGQMNGFHNSLIEEDCFLFTSESVGEGHPGKPIEITALTSCSPTDRSFVEAGVFIRSIRPL